MKRPNTFKRYLKMICPFDWIIVGGLFIAAFIPYLIFGIHENQQQATASQQVLTAVVTHDGHEVYRKRLTGHTGPATSPIVIKTVTGIRLKSKARESRLRKLTVRIRSAFAAVGLRNPVKQFSACRISYSLRLSQIKAIATREVW